MSVKDQGLRYVTCLQAFPWWQSWVTWQQVIPTATAKLNTQNNRIVSHEKNSNLLCYAIVNVCKFCIYCWQHKCPTEIFHSCIYPSSRAVLTDKRNFFYRFAIRSWASVARFLCYSWATCCLTSLLFCGYSRFEQLSWSPKENPWQQLNLAFTKWILFLSPGQHSQRTDLDTANCREGIKA